MDKKNHLANDAFDELENVIMHGTKGFHMLATKQGKDCKGLCDSFSTGRPFKEPYTTHFLCRRCGTGNGIWANLNLLNNGNCPCCNHRPKMKSYRKTHNITDV